jgi:hypothetical protein|tara:strand:+ start:62 stop:223 length:162 start_codon:yes stop_codon:yes gene_type:complete
MRTIGKIIVDLLSDNQVSAEEAEMLITHLSDKKEPLGISPERTSSPYWYQTTT